jgi:hypothetical protein
MATAITPFGESFGDPRRYMGQSPFAQIGQAAKTALTLYGLEKSGAIKGLDNLGLKSDGKGGFSIKPPDGSVPPITSGPGGLNADGVFGTNAMTASPMTLNQPMMPVAPVQPMGAQVTPLGQDAPSNVQINTFAPPPPDAGRQLLDNMYKPQSAVDVKNETDFNPLAPDQSNQFAMTGNEYQQIPGFGSTQDKAVKLMKLMGMG